MNAMIDQAVAAFVQEARDLLARLEDDFLSLEDGASKAKIDEIFRALHTIKGSGAMFGYTLLSRFTHQFESAFEKVRAGALAVDRPLIDVCLAACDVMAAFLDIDGDAPEAAALLGSDRANDVATRLAAVTGDDGEVPTTAPRPEPAPAAWEEARPSRWRIRFAPDVGALRNGMRPDLLLQELRGLGALTIAYDADAVPPLSDFDPCDAVLAYDLTLETDAPRAAIEDVFIFADDAELRIAEADAAPEHEAASDEPAVPEAQAAPEPPPAPARRDASSESIRVASARLDEMMDSLGELVIAQARLDAVVQEIDHPALEGVAEEVARLITGLRDATLSLRMLPIETVFGKFKRVVRDLAGELGKDVRLVAQGGETEVDKNVIDRIGDPIVHMIRNAIDHGIEPAEERLAAGKPPQGTLRLSARQEGGEILIAIQDDGRGLDLDAIRARAIERGVLAPDAAPTDAELRQLIFEPGFSTAAQVSAVSGRGVGMDAVKSALDALGGAVEVVSRQGVGARVTLRLPVTMAIIDGLRVRLGGSVYVVPLSSVEECVELSEADAASRSGRSLLRIRDEMVPFLELSRLFNQPGDPAARRRVVIVRVDGARVGLVVDDILGQGQTVIKSLSCFHNSAPGLGGATILGDGRVALIVDVATLVRAAEATRGDGTRRAA
jgi:two-component system chemotaxis sensor kinase CheA